MTEEEEEEKRKHRSALRALNDSLISFKVLYTVKSSLEAAACNIFGGKIAAAYIQGRLLFQGAPRTKGLPLIQSIDALFKQNWPKTLRSDIL